VNRVFIVSLAPCSFRSGLRSGKVTWMTIMTITVIMIDDHDLVGGPPAVHHSVPDRHLPLDPGVASQARHALRGGPLQGDRQLLLVAWGPRLVS
jgi:hypothetical protein